jgi:putative ABC transport system permease protein
LFLDKNNNPIKLDRGGLAISKKLAEVLGVGVGDQIMVEMLQGKKRQLNLFVEYLVEDYTGLMAYTNFKVFQSLTGESRMYHGAYIRTDPLLWPDLFEEIKSIPEISVTVVKKDQLQAFRKSTGNNMNILTQLYITLSIIVAFGVVYNHTRITLSERQRDLSTMLVMGMKRLEIFVLLLTELLLVLMVAVPLGFLMGIGLIYLITNSLQTETVRLPILLNLSSFTMGILILLVASMSSFMIVMRSIGSMNHLDVLKARD